MKRPNNRLPADGARRDVGGRRGFVRAAVGIVEPVPVEGLGSVGRGDASSQAGGGPPLIGWGGGRGLSLRLRCRSRPCATNRLTSRCS